MWPILLKVFSFNCIRRGSPWAILFFFLFCSSTSYGLTPEIQAVEDRLAKNLELFNGNTIVQPLIQFRSQVEQEAYLVTLKLCQGYRKAIGKTTPLKHENLVFSTAQSLAAWGKVFGKGLMQPLSGIGGIKSNEIAAGDYELFQLESWFRSTYVLYLVNSFGFLRAGVHCLGTIDEGELIDFATAILGADVAGSTLTLAGPVAYAAPKIVQLILWVTSPVWRPVSNIVHLLNSKLNYAYITMATATFSPNGSEWVNQYLEQRSQKSELATKIAMGDPETKQEHMRSRRRGMVVVAYQNIVKLGRAQREARLSQKLCENCQILRENFQTYVKAAFTNKSVQKLKQDLLYYQQNPNLESSEQKAIKAFPVMIPLIENALNE